MAFCARLPRFCCLLLPLLGTPVVAAHGQAEAGPQSPNMLPDAPLAASSSSSSSAPAAQTSGDAQSSGDNLTILGTPRRTLQDEWHILTSPARIGKQDLPWLLPLAGATGAALATDTYTMRHVVSHTSTFNTSAVTASDDLRDGFIGVPVALYGVGLLTHNDHTRESGFLAGQAMIDAFIIDEGIKYVTLRERPNLQNSRGWFFQGDAAGDPSFVSGHSMVAWSSAAVLADEYPNHWAQAGIYTLAAGTSLTRVLGQQHFPSDVLLGSAAGWLIGHYVFRTHHRVHAR